MERKWTDFAKACSTQTEEFINNTCQVPDGIFVLFVRANPDDLRCSHAEMLICYWNY
jgi:hypothetical protein